MTHGFSNTCRDHPTADTDVVDMKAESEDLSLYNFALCPLLSSAALLGLHQHLVSYPQRPCVQSLDCLRQNTVAFDLSSYARLSAKPEHLHPP